MPDLNRIAFLQASIQKLETALGTGLKRVRVNGGTAGERETEYFGQEQIQAALSYFQQQLAVANGQPIRRAIRMSIGSGL